LEAVERGVIFAPRHEKSCLLYVGLQTELLGNLYTISRMFEQKGYKKTNFTDTPDIFIINTCSVTENADKKCHKIVREARAISPDAYVAIIGCYAQLKPAGDC
jgi:hypothetical protein